MYSLTPPYYAEIKQDKNLLKPRVFTENQEVLFFKGVRKLIRGCKEIIFIVYYKVWN